MFRINPALFRFLLGLFSCFFLIIGLLIASIEIGAFSDRGFYRREYQKYQVAETIDTTDEDLSRVTDTMLTYLQGRRSDLVVTVGIGGITREFFNDREKLHMKDVQILNANAVTVMVSCFLSFVMLLYLLILTYKPFFLPCEEEYPALFPERKTPETSGVVSFFRSLSLSCIASVVLFLLSVGIGAVIVSRDFDKYWRMFHGIFFHNDLWLLDPATDLLINIVPSGFFADLIIRIAALFSATLGLLLAASVCFLWFSRRKKHLRSAGVLAVFLCLALTLRTVPVSAADKSEIEQLIASLPDSSSSWPTAPAVTSAHAILMDADTGTILYEKDSLTSAYPASTTKMMTGLLALEALPLSMPVTFSANAIYELPAGASHIGMRPGEILTVEDCLYGLLLPSANEVANALAEATTDRLIDFLSLMNTTASKLGCVNTHFNNPNGLEDILHVTCAYDLACIAKACSENADFVRISGTATYIIPATNKVKETRPVKNTHKMLDPYSEYYDSRVVFGKTGTTDAAGSCLVTFARNETLSLICVVMNAENPHQYTDTAALLNYGFDHFTHVSPSIADSGEASQVSVLPATHVSKALSSYMGLAGSQVLTLPTHFEASDLKKTSTLSDGLPKEIAYYFDGYLLGSFPVVLTPQSLKDTETLLYDTGALPVSRCLPAQTVMEQAAENPLFFLICGVVALQVLILLLLLRPKKRKKATYHH